MTEEKTTININIHGGNNQILPNATHAEQHFHYHNTEAAYQPSRTRIYNNVEVDAGYIEQLHKCYTAANLAVKAEFFTNLLPFCPNLKKGKTECNIRAHINNELASKPTKPYGQQH